MERIRDATVAEGIAAEAGTDATPELSLGEVVSPVVLLNQRPPLASSGYLAGVVGVAAAAVALNTSHAGIFISGVGGAIGRINWFSITNATGGDLFYRLRRLDSPFTGFPSVRAVPGYINAGNPTTGRVFTVTKTDTVGANGVFMADVEVFAGSTQLLWGPWILNDGALIVTCNTVNTEARFNAGYEVWNAIRVQPVGG